MSNIPMKNSYHGYSIGDTVYVKPADSNLLKGIVIDFQRLGNNLPIVEFNHPYKQGEICKNAFELTRISKKPTLIIPEWRFVNIEYKYHE